MDGSVVPAWKKLGLRVKETASETNVPEKDDSKSSQLKRKRETADDPQDETEKTQKKPPKRPKLPKSERKPPPESDQLVYLRSYTQNREEWKFSKSKQNWIIRHIYNKTAIPEEYHKYLLTYLEGIQGSVKQRIVENGEKTISEWNTFMSEKDDSEKEEDEEAEEKPTEEVVKKQKKKKATTSPTPPSEEIARLAQSIVRNLGQKEVKLVFLDDQAGNSDNEKENL